MLNYAKLPESDTLRYLRAAQLRALETYRYSPLVEGTPHIFEFYQRYYPRPLDLLAALGLDRDEIKDFVRFGTRSHEIGETREARRSPEPLFNHSG